MAEVRRGLDERLQRPVAIKLMHPHLATDPDFRRRFEKEARAAARLSHPNVVAVYDTGEHEGRPFIVMERMAGSTLADRMAEGPLDAAAARQIALEVLAALHAAHGAHILHRDVKPGNILVTAEGRIKVADFGIAKVADANGHADPTTAHILLGTPAYLAPERVAGQPASPCADIFSLGVVLYEALTGSRPFKGDTPVAVALSVERGAPPLRSVRPDVEPALAAVVERAMSADPTARYPSARAMADALAPGAAPVGDAVAHDTVASAYEPRGRRLRGAVSIAAAVGLLLGALAFVALSGRSTPSAVADPTLAEEIREVAERLSDDGGRAREASARLELLADEVVAGGGASAASALWADAEDWRLANELGTMAYAALTEVLHKVPGVTPPPTATTTLAPGPSGGDDEVDDGRKRGRKNDD